MKFKQPIGSVFITEIASQKRFQITKFHIENNTDIKNIVFTDKSCNIDKNQIADKVLQKKQAHAPKVMIWGGIVFNIKTDLDTIECNANTESYIGQIIFGSNLIESPDKRFGVEDWLLMQDNANSTSLRKL